MVLDKISGSLLHIIISLSIILLCFFGVYQAVFADDEIEITTCEQLQNINSDLSANYVLRDNVDCADTLNWNEGVGFEPIGSLDSAFTGTLNGNGYIISGIFINRPGHENVGLFGYIGAGAELFNLGLQSADVVGNENVGLIAGYNDGSMSNLFTSGTVKSIAGIRAGGFVGHNDENGVIENSYTTGNVDGDRIFINPFIVLIKTNEPGDSDDNSVFLPLIGSYFIDWGDGTVENLSGPQSHTYIEPGEYTIKIAGDLEGINFNNEGDKDKIIEIKSWGDIEWLSLENAFMGTSNLDVTAKNVPNLTNITNITNLFHGASSLAGNEYFNDWDVSGIQNMENMFKEASLFNQYLGDWQLRKAGVNMSEIFSDSGMSLDNYSESLITWANYVIENNAPLNVNMTDQTDMEYDSTISEKFLNNHSAYFLNAISARDFLINESNWTISGDFDVSQSSNDGIVRMLIYDESGGHFNAISNLIEHYVDDEYDVEIHRIFSGFAGPWERSIISYVKENNINLVYIPYSGLSPNVGTSIFKALNIPIIKPYGTGFFPNDRVYRSTITFGGGDMGATEPTTVNFPMLDFYSEVAHLSESDKYLASWVGAKISSFVGYLLDLGYDAWETRQILRQNANSFEDWSIENGFGKIEAESINEIIIPDTILLHPAVDVIPTIFEGSNALNPGAAFLRYTSFDNNFIDNQEGLIIPKGQIPIIINETDDEKLFSFDYSTDYGSEFSLIEFSLEEQYKHVEPPKRPELFFWVNFTNQKRFRVGTLSSSSNDIVEQERDFDRISRVRVYDDEMNILVDFDRPFFDDAVLFESINNPLFSLTETGNTYFIQIKTWNIYGESPWSPKMEIADDLSYQGQIFDFRDEAEDLDNLIVGGFVGENHGEVKDSFSTSLLFGDGIVGGFVGHNEGVISNAYFWDRDDVFLSCDSINLGSISCTSINTNQDGEGYFFNITNQPMNHWNFDDIWDDSNDGVDYLILQQFKEESSSTPPSGGGGGRSGGGGSSFVEVEKDSSEDDDIPFTSESSNTNFVAQQFLPSVQSLIMTISAGIQSGAVSSEEANLLFQQIITILQNLLLILTENN